MRFRDLPRELRLELSAMFFIPGLILTIIAVNHYIVTPARLPPFFADLDVRVGAWNVWGAVVGPILLLGGGYYFVDTIRKRREFSRLLETESKAKFVRNQDRLEKLAWWYLGSEYVKKVEKKKEDFNVR